ncbi:hypothetical protein H0A61_00224 [Koleobacter methoxysyntrophicus]|uniref:Uncharacterized protein n=1 Tax=Koleobacter methoxysyntrophicus TaxID=2751313 RepID=A0A8A0RK82_9FIRM|nr:hypothetical protein H0A61_00224 [Koleobacter methoxysyntrophicus]
MPVRSLNSSVLKWPDDKKEFSMLNFFRFAKMKFREEGLRERR